MDGVLLYLDEIQHFNKETTTVFAVLNLWKRQDNAYRKYNGKSVFFMYNAVLSRSVVFEFKQIEPSEIEKALERAVEELKQSDYKGFDVTVDKDAIRHMAHVSNGDARKALNSLEVAFIATPPNKDKKYTYRLTRRYRQRKKKLCVTTVTVTVIMIF